MQRGHKGRGRQIGTFLAGAGRSTQHPGHRTTGEPPPNPGPTNAAAWATTGCNVVGPSTSTPTARQLPQPYTTTPLQEPDR